MERISSSFHHYQVQGDVPACPLILCAGTLVMGKMVVGLVAGRGCVITLVIKD